MYTNDDAVSVFIAIVFLVAFVIGGILGFSVGQNSGNKTWQKVIIEHGAAHYDSQTGIWKWNDEQDK